METSGRRRRTCGAEGGTPNLRLPSRSWWCCACAPKGCHLVLVLLSWTIFFLSFCMPYLVKGQFVSRQTKEDYSVDSHECGDYIKGRAGLVLDSFVDDPRGELGENRDLQQGCIRSKHVCGDFQPLCFPCTPAGFTAEIDSSQRCSDEETTENNGKKLRLNQAARSYEITGQRQVKSRENVTFRLIDGRTTVSCFNSVTHESNKQTSIQTGYLEQIQPVIYEGYSSPNVAISPPFMDWGPQHLFSPEVAFLTVVNTCNDTVLRVFKPFSTNSQFYAYNFEETIVAAGEMISIAFVFLPRMLGLAAGHLILQTSSGGFLIQAQGEGIESPYRIQSFTRLNAFSGSRLLDNVTLYNPFDGLLYIEEISAWIANSAATSTKPIGAVCKTDAALKIDDTNLLVNEDGWFKFEKDAMDISWVQIRPSGGWEINPHCSSTIMEIDIATHIEGNISGALCVKLKNSLRDTCNMVIVPLEVQIVKTAGHDAPVHPLSIVMKSGAVSEREQTITVTLSLNNGGLEVIRLEEIYESSADSKLFQINYVPDLFVFPGTVTHVATVTYKHTDKIVSLKDNERQGSNIPSDCKIVVITNNTASQQLEVLCRDLIYDFVDHKHAWTDAISESTYGGRNALYGQGIPSDMENQFQDSHSVSSSVLKEKTLEFASEMDGLIWKNWKSQGSSENLYILAESELWYPMVQIGTKVPKWVNVSNPSQHPVVMQLILSSEAVADLCKNDGDTWEGWEPSHSYQTAPRLISDISEDYGDIHYTDVFSLPEDGVKEAYIPPHGRAAFGPIFFHPSKRCVWTGSVFIKNNLSGVEWLPLQGAGGSGTLTFLEGAKQVQALYFNFNVPLVPPSTMGAMKFYSRELFYRAGMKAVCSKPMSKWVLARNTGDMPLEVKTIEVGGSPCGSDGFRIHTCDSFFLAPGESTELLISYQTDFSAAVVYKDLRLAMSSGSLVIPMRASLPGYMVTLCHKSFFWLILRKIVLIICLVASLSFVVFCRWLAQDTALIDLGRWSQGKKFEIAAPKMMHNDHLKQRSVLGSKALEVGCGHSKFPAIKVKIPKESNTEAVVSKTRECVWEGTYSSNCQKGQERNCHVSQSDSERMNWLPDSKNKDSINSDVAGSPCRDTIGSAQVLDGENCFLPSAVPESLNSMANAKTPEGNKKWLHDNMKWLHDNKNKDLLNSDLGGSLSRNCSGSSEVSDAQDSLLLHTVPDYLNSMAESNPMAGSPNAPSPQVSSSLGRCLTVKLEKEKGRRRRKKSGAISVKQEVSGSQSGNSTPSSPASPITPITTSRPVSPHVKSVSVPQSSLMPSNCVGSNDLKHPVELNGYKSLVLNKIPRTTFQRERDDASQAGLVTDLCNKHSVEASGNKLSDERSLKQTSSQRALCGVAADSSKTISRQKHAEDWAVEDGDWAAVAKKPANLNLNKSKGIRLDESNLHCSSKMVGRPVLTTSATFPCGGRRESSSVWNLPILVDTKQMMISSPSTSSLVSTSAMAPHARAPGTKLIKNSSAQVEHNGCLKSDLMEQEFTYDIWGNHFGQFHLIDGSNVPAATTGLPKRSMLSSSQDYSQSFFARFAPQSLLEKPTTTPSSSSIPPESFCHFPTN